MGSTPNPQEGTTSNRYTILGKLAGGGMADILLARAVNESGVERYVVLKRVLPERSRDLQFARMFLDEARLAAQLHHPNIAQVYDIGRLAGSYFFTMEYVHGEDVRALLHKLATTQRQLPIGSALHIASGALAALQHAHTRTSTDGKQLGVVHRDVSPANVMVSYEGHVKLLDFGVAKAAHRATETRTGTIKGKIAYLSPEQCQGSPVDRRSDIFSLGVVLYEMLTCRRLYKRDADFSTMLAIVNEPTPAPSSLRPELTPAIDALVLRALAKDREQRFASAAEMMEAIEMVVEQERHVLSATSTGRVLRELFGERPEPWVELRSRTDQPAPLTITSESVSQAALPAVEVTDEPSAVEHNLEAVNPFEDYGSALETQIHETPALYDAATEDMEEDDMLVVPPTLITTAPKPPAQPPFEEPPETRPEAPPPVAAMTPARGVAAPPPAPAAATKPRTPPRGVATTPAPAPSPTAAPARPLPGVAPAEAPGVGATEPRPLPGVAPSTGAAPAQRPLPGVAPSTGAAPAQRPLPGVAPSTGAAPAQRPLPGVPPMHAPSEPPVADAAPLPAPPIAAAPLPAPPPVAAAPLPAPPAPPAPAPAPPIAPPPESTANLAYPIATAAPDTDLRPRSRIIPIAIAACVTLGGAFVLMKVLAKSDEPSSGSGSATVGTGGSQASIDAPAAVEPPPIDAAEVVAVPVDAAAPSPTITTASAAGAWSDVLELCAAKKLKSLSVDDRTRCGVAACNAKQRASAITYRASVGGANQATIEKACKTKGIALPTGPTQPPVDPCEKNPLKCRT